MSTVIVQNVSGNFYGDILLPGLVFSTIDTTSATQFTLVNDTDANITAVVTGTGLTFDAGGLAGGTVESVTFQDNGVTTAEVTGLGIDGEALGDAIADARGGDFSAFDALLEAEPVDYSAAAVPSGGVTYEGTPNGDTILGSGAPDNLRGGVGNDTINPGDGNDFISGTAGTDTIIYSQSTPGSSYQGLAYRYFGASEGLLVTIDGTTNTATVEKGAAGIDTIVDIANPLISGGGFGIEGTEHADVFNLSILDGQWMQVLGAAGDDSINILAGQVRVDYGDSINGINVDLSAGIATDDGFGDTDTFTGDVWEIRGSDFDDIIVGSDNNESFIGQMGDDFIDGRGGTDRLTLNRPGVSDVVVDLRAGTATGIWDGGVFNYTIANLERVDTGAGNDRIFGDDGANALNGGDGDDEINPGDNPGFESDFITGSRGNDTIDYTDSVNGFQGIAYIYYGATEGLTATINGIANTASVDKGAAGIDTFVNIATALEGAGLSIEGTAFADSFTISNGSDQWVRIRGDAGDDTIEILSGEVALGFSRAQNGIDVDLLAGTVSDDGFGFTDTIIGTVAEVQGGDFADTIVGHDHGVKLRGRGGDDVLIGGDSIDELSGGDGNDTLTPGNNTEYDFIEGSRGFDTIDYSLSTEGYQEISYRFLDASVGLLVAIDGVANTATVDKGVDGLDTINDIANPLDNGGFGIEGTALADVFNIAIGAQQWMQVKGSAGNDTINQTSGRIRLDYNNADGGIQVDLEAGLALNDGFGDQDTLIGVFDQFRGSDHDDTIALGAGWHTIEGEDGHDTVVYDGARSEFQIDLENNGDILVNKTGGDLDTLIDVERIDLTDGDLIYDLTGPNLGFTYRMYSSLGRTPDEGGLRFWTGVLDYLDANAPWLDKEVFLANQFLASNEFALIYGEDPSNEQFIDGMYNYFLGRAPDAPGRAFWIGGMEQGLGRDDILIAFSECDENQLRTAPDIDQGVWVV